MRVFTIKKYLLAFIILFFIGCSVKQPLRSTSSTIIIKSQTLKFYDKGFVNYYDDYINLQLFNIGTLVLDLFIYKNKICKGTLQCMSAEKFNAEYLSSSYRDQFLYELFMK